MLQNKNGMSTTIKVLETPSLVTILKTIFIGVIACVLVFMFIQNKDSNNAMSDGVVFKNLSKTYQNIESSYDSVLINKNESTDSNTTPVSTEGKHNVFVVDYNGTLMATEVKYLKSKIDAIILKSNPNDEVVVKIHSPGGSVTGYGLVASQLNRLKIHGLKVTAVIDQVAASGGYMAAVVADEIVAAPFSMVGSIGVVANVMIYEELLNNLGVESRVYTAGESKRTVVPTKVPTKEEEEKLKAELTQIHDRFKEHVLSYRPNIAIDKVFTGQAFLAADALGLGLVDKIGTSDEILLQLYKDGQRLVKVDYQLDNSFASSITKQVSTSLVDAIKTELSNSVVYQ